MKLQSLFFLLCYGVLVQCRQAIVIVPVADLVGAPIEEFYPHLSVEEGYAALPLCGGNTNRLNSCPRVHQLLFNETVTVLEYRNQQARIQISHVFSNREHSTQKHYTYWTLKKNIVDIATLKAKRLDLSYIPLMPSFATDTIETAGTVALAVPFADPLSKVTFSAGTRFVIAQHDKKTDDSTSVMMFNPARMSYNTLAIPNHLLIQEQTTPDLKRKAFISLLKKWAQQLDGFIPYVWGGCSFTQLCQGSYSEVKKSINNETISYFALSDDMQSPKGGMDCTGLVARAAQACGIPYFYKNSVAVTHNLQELKQSNNLELGDIIWIPGHVMVVSDIENNMLIEARSCLHDGPGKVQEVALEKVFKDIQTYQQLITACSSKKPLQRLGIQGNVEQVIKECKILKLVITE